MVRMHTWSYITHVFRIQSLWWHRNLAVMARWNPHDDKYRILKYERLYRLLRWWVHSSPARLSVLMADSDKISIQKPDRYPQPEQRLRAAQLYSSTATRTTEHPGSTHTKIMLIWVHEHPQTGTRLEFYSLSAHVLQDRPWDTQYVWQHCVQRFKFAH